MVDIAFFRAISQNNLGFLSELYNQHASTTLDAVIRQVDSQLDTHYGDRGYSLYDFVSAEDKVPIYMKMHKDQEYNMAATIITQCYGVYLYEIKNQKKITHLYGSCFGIIPASVVALSATPEDILSNIPMAIDMVHRQGDFMTQDYDKSCLMNVQGATAKTIQTTALTNNLSSVSMALRYTSTIGLVSGPPESLQTLKKALKSQDPSTKCNTLPVNYVMHNPVCNTKVKKTNLIDLSTSPPLLTRKIYTHTSTPLKLEELSDAILNYQLYEENNIQATLKILFLSFGSDLHILDFGCGGQQWRGANNPRFLYRSRD